MTATVGLLVLCVLWVLLCMRFYTVIARENVLQRRLIALGAGLGAGLIYLLGTMIIGLLQEPSEDDPQRVIEEVEDVRVQGR